MAVDWPRFFTQHSIEFVEEGANVARGNVNIACPYCLDDPSHHMGVSLRGDGWGCWRDSKHRGKSAIKLIMALLKCPYERARELAGYQTYIADDFLSYINGKLNPETNCDPDRVLKLPDEFRPFRDVPAARIFMRYLEGRDYTPKQIMRLTQQFGIRFCTRGAYKGRVMFPVHFEGKLVSWTGRTVYPGQLPRYKTLSNDPEKAEREGYDPALGPVSDYLLWWDDLIKSECDTLYLEEGPFDALKTRVLGERHGITATCFFTAQPTRQQVQLLHELLPRFKHKYLLLDQVAQAKALEVQALLTLLGVSVKQLPAHVKDPGELTMTELLKI